MLPPGPAASGIAPSSQHPATNSQDGTVAGVGEDLSVLSPLERTLKNFFRVQPQGAPDPSLPPPSPVASLPSIPSARSPRPPSSNPLPGRPPVPPTLSASSSPKPPLSNESQASDSNSQDLSSVPSVNRSSALPSPARYGAPQTHLIRAAAEGLMEAGMSPPGTMDAGSLNGNGHSVHFEGDAALPPTITASKVEANGRRGRSERNGAAGGRVGASIGELVGQGSLYGVDRAAERNGRAEYASAGRSRGPGDASDSDGFEDCVEDVDGDSSMRSSSMQSSVRDDMIGDMPAAFGHKLRKETSNAGSVFSCVSDLSSPRALSKELSHLSHTSSASVRSRQRSPEMDDLIHFDSR